MAYYSFDGYHFDGNENDTIFKPTSYLYGDPKKGFSKELYNYYISKRDYESAGKYSLMFSLDGENAPNNSTRRYKIYKMMREGRKRNALLGRLDDSERDEIDLYESFMHPEALATLDPKNEALKRFNRLKSEFVYGQYISPNEKLGNLKTPKTIEINFESDQHNFLWWNIDNDNSFKNFLQRSGYNEDYLRSKGVKIDSNKGKPKLTFDYDSSFANEFIYNLSKHSTDMALYDYPIDVKAYDNNGNIIKLENNNNPYSDYRVPNSVSLSATRAGLANYIDILKSKKEKVYEKDAKHLYTSTLFGDITDRASYLRQMYDATPADNNELRTKIKQQLDMELAPVKNFISNIGYANYKIYSDAYEDDLILREVTTDNISQVKDVIVKSLNDSEVFPILGEMGGKYGTFITVPFKAYKDDEVSLLEKTPNHRTITYFIEGLFGEEAQKKADSDSEFRAMRELDDVEAYNYSYPLQNGKTIIPVREPKGNNGDYDVRYLLSDGDNAAPIDKTIAHRLIEDEMIREDYFYALYDHFISNDGRIITKTNDGKDIFEEAKKGAVKIVNSLYRNTPPISLEDLNIKPEDYNNVPNQISDKIKEAMELYFEVLEKLKLKSQ